METKIKAKIVGAAPYLQHRFVEQKKGRGKNIPTPEVEAERAAYKNDKGFYIPGRQIKMSMVRAAVDFKYAGKKTFKQFVMAGIVISPAEVPLPNKKYEILSLPVMIQRARIVRNRPMFREWEAEFEIVLLDETVCKPAILKEILTAAGKFKGIGDFRPEYGRFKVEKFEG